MVSHLVINTDVTNFENYKKYLSVALDLMMRCGGKPVLDSNDHTIIHGNPRKVLVVVEFPGSEEIENFLNSPELAEVEDIRENNSEGWMVRVDGKSPDDKIEGWELF